MINPKQAPMMGPNLKLSHPWVWAIVVLGLLLLKNLAFSQPIGGYARANFKPLKYKEVTTPEGLLEMLRWAEQPGKDTIYITNSITLDSSYKMLKIPEGTCIISPGKTITSKHWWKGLKDTGLVFVTNGPDISLIGINAVGVSPEIGDADYSQGYQGFIKVNHPGFIMRDCIVQNFPTWAVWLSCADYANIQYNRFAACRQEGYGYGVWVGGCGGTTDRPAYIYRNEFTKCRHAVASSGHHNSWYIDNCVFHGPNYNVVIDRHTGNHACIGGGDMYITDNYFLGIAHPYGIQYPAKEGAEILVKGNYFSTDSLKSGAVCVDKWYESNPEICSYAQNKFSRQGMILPTATIVQEGNTMSFEYSDLYNRPFLRNQWLINNQISHGKTLKLPTTPGLYTLQLTVWNNEGIPSLPILQEVRIGDPGSLLTFYYKDSYRGELKGRYEISVLINSTKIWKRDIQGNSQAFNRVSLNLPNVTDTVKIRLTCLNPQGISGLLVTLDDIGFQDYLENFESTPKWKTRYYSPPGGTTPGSTLFHGDPCSGEYALSWKFGARSTYIPGQYVEIRNK